MAGVARPGLATLLAGLAALLAVRNITLRRGSVRFPGTLALPVLAVALRHNETRSLGWGRGTAAAGMQGQDVSAKTNSRLGRSSLRRGLRR